MTKLQYFILLLSLTIFSCDSSRVYEDYENMEDAFWHMDSVKQFSFEITDAQIEYNILATFRNTSAYPFYNIYFQYTLRDSLDSIVYEQLEKADLFDPVSGQPRGSGLGDMFDHSIPILEDFVFPATGLYSITLQQQMRLDSLPYLLSVGARVEVSEE